MKTLLLVLGLVGTFTGCGAPLSGGHPAHVVGKGNFRVSATVDVQVPTGVIADTVESAKNVVDAVENNEALTDAQKRTLLKAGAGLAITPPAVMTPLQVAYGLTDKLELDLRAAAGGYWRLGGRWQFLVQAVHGLDLSAGLGVARSSYEFPVSGVVRFVKIDDFKRFNIDVPILIGKRSDYHRWWLGSRLVYWNAETTLHLDLPGAVPERASFDASGLIVGGQAGIVGGYKWFFIGVELTMAQNFGTAHLSALSAKNDVDVSSFIVYPALVAVGEF
ncbi:MAG: hypothetical protein SGI86_07940 [Deltaproteobacteria bacterium]|nr:hypothetical protein [Deltaproteobacteria bacterium]